MRVEIGLGIPAIRRNLTDGIRSVGEQAPEGIRVLGARKTAADTDNGDRLRWIRCPSPTGLQGLRPRPVFPTRQVAGEFVDRWIVVEQGRRERDSEPILQIAGDLNNVTRCQAVIGKSLRGLDIGDRQVHGLGHPFGQPIPNLVFTWRWIFHRRGSASMSLC